MLDDIKRTIWAAAEYKHLVLGLIFVKYISDTIAVRDTLLPRLISGQLRIPEA
jgi:type I restriction-modification system DNA methylase subunit